MKKRIIIIAISLFSVFSARAQYFQRDYFTSSSVVGFSKGITTTIGGLEHVIVAGGAHIYAAGADINSTVVFNKQYDIVPAAPFVADGYLHPQVFEKNGNELGLVGTFYKKNPVSGAGETSVYYLQLDATGNLLANKSEYKLAAPPSYPFQFLGVTSVKRSASGTHFYVTGAVYNISNFITQHSMVMKIDAGTGAIVWSQVFNINNTGDEVEAAMDVVESPYNNGDEVAVVGYTVADYHSIKDCQAYFIRFDQATGTIIGSSAYLYGATNDETVFSGIDIAQCTTGGSDGFIICGWTDKNGDADMVITKTNWNGGVLWSTTQDCGAATGTNSIAWDVIERLNSSSNYEYYACGYVSIPGGGGTYSSYAEVIKVDDAGNAVSNGDFIYGNGTELTEGYSISQDAGGGPNGINVFGNRTFTSTSTIVAYQVKAYYNGVSGCDEIFEKAVTDEGPDLVAEEIPIEQATMNAFSITANVGSDDYDSLICYADNVTGGDNSIVAPTTSVNTVRNSGTAIYPNPVQQGAGSVTIEMKDGATTARDITVYDMVGKQLLKVERPATTSDKRIVFDISHVKMTAGIYTIQMHTNKGMLNAKLVVQ